MSSRRRSRWSSKRPGLQSPEPKPTPDQSPALIDLYKIALDEYRFQVNLNWSRTQYYIVLNVAILGLATGLLRIEDRTLSAVVGTGLYFAGTVCCVLALFAGTVQRSYFRQTKAHKAKLEELLELGDLAIKTTPGMGGPARRIAKVTTFHNAIISILLVLDLGGLVYSVVQILPSCSK